MRTSHALSHALVLALAITGCGGLDEGTVATDGAGSGSGGGVSSGEGGDSTGAGSGGTGQGTNTEPGQLTAAEWDDNANYEWFQYALTRDLMPAASKAMLPLDGHIVAQIVDADGTPVSGAQVQLVGMQRTFVAGTDGRVVLTPGLDGDHTLHITAPDGTTFDAAASTHIVMPGNAHAPTALDLAFVVDATGSMGDEIAYLQAEIDAIAASVAQTHPGISTRFALIVYRDTSDAYVTRTFDFATLSSFRANLQQQSANGGGDYPEAAEVAMQKAVTQLGWRTGNVARVLFHVADAPPHDPAYATFLDAALKARTRGIRIFPVAASGVALEAEYLMRTSALVTAGRYLFLTDDSGIGNTHEVPRIPCFRVERLSTLLSRTLDSELTGHYVAPDDADVIRTVGTFEGDQCVWQQDTMAAQ
jgi:hypothetical protein